MKKVLLSAIIGIAGITSGHAIIAYPDPVTVTQPDGSEITLVMHGDEFCNFTTTTDGYTVVQADCGTWQYARLDNHGLIKATGIQAHEPAMRSDAETEALLATPRMLRQQSTSAQAQLKLAAKAMQQQSADQRTARAGNYDYNKFRGLVILVEYSDQKFSRDDAHEIFSRMVNEENFTGFNNTGILATKINYTGSVRDYYRDNSLGLFNPTFDVVGPVQISYSKEFIQQTTFASTIMTAATIAADPLVDYADYDTDGDGKVDMVYFIFAGAGSNYTGNNRNLVWPHASEFYNHTLDGVKLGRYACSTELYGRESNHAIDGIGTICHEFSHVLGLPDLYDTDYATNGQSSHPGNWSIMAQGGYLNSAKTPCGYSAYERYAIGFSTPRTITDAGDYTLPYIADDGMAYRIDSPVENEYFLLENRCRRRWDQYLPGEGMLVFRVDSTDVSVWQNNRVNCNADHNYYELVRAMPRSVAGSTSASAADPFPGTGGVTTLRPETFSGQNTALTLHDIEQTAPGGDITFTVRNEAGESAIDAITYTGRTSPRLHVSIHGNQATVTNAEGPVLTARDLSGRTVATAAVGPDGQAAIILPLRGAYIITDSRHAAKIVL